jgi:hypothetical protein
MPDAIAKKNWNLAQILSPSDFLLRLLLLLPELYFQTRVDKFLSQSFC